jgi:hypothetical protein
LKKARSIKLTRLDVVSVIVGEDVEDGAVVGDDRSLFPCPEDVNGRGLRRILFGGSSNAPIERTKRRIQELDRLPGIPGSEVP